MRLSAFLVCALACGNNDEPRPTLVPTSVEIGNLYTCVIEATDDGVDGGMDAGGMDAGGMDAGMDAGMPDAGATDAGLDAGGVDDGELDPLIRPSCWAVGDIPQRLDVGQPLRGRIFLGDPICNLADGQLSCLGLNEHGQVGDGTETPTESPVRVITPRPVTGVAVNRFITDGFACALLENGTVSCWGNGESGQLGNGFSENRNTPTNVPGVSGGYLISAGGAHVCVAVRNEEMGTQGISCWGVGDRGQLGDGNSNDSGTPVDVAIPSGDSAPTIEAPVALSAGGMHTCALDVDGEVWCWGAGDLGQIGNGTTVDQSRPTRVSLRGLVEEGEPEPMAVGLSAGANHTCIVTSDGLVACWGGNDRLQTGVGGGDTVLSPSAVVEDASMVAAGLAHSCAIVGTTVQCWGHGGYLGSGATDGDTSTPRTVRY